MKKLILVTMVLFTTIISFTINLANKQPVNANIYVPF